MFVHATVVCDHNSCLLHSFIACPFHGMTLSLRHATPFLFLRILLLTLAGDLGNPSMGV
jgi:hypothetical protein